MKVTRIHNIIPLKDRPRKKKTKDDFKKLYNKPPNDSA